MPTPKPQQGSPAVAEPIISVSGLRGVVGETLTPEVAVRYVVAFAAVAPPGPIVIGWDGRPSGPMLRETVCAGLHAVGRHTLDAQLAATPTLGILVRHHGAAGGVQITASHNPAPYNGLKLFGPEGRVLPEPVARLVLQQYRSGTPQWVAYDRLGTSQQCPDPLAPHLEAILATVDAPRIRARRFRVLLDSNHGVGSLLGRRLLAELGCETRVLGEPPDGRFAHAPEPLAENLAEVASAVRTAAVDVGFCQDPDADRLAIIDAAGTYLGEEYTLALCVDHVLRQRSGPVVANCCTSRMIDDIASRFGVPVFRSAVGEANVVDMMQSTGAVFGGEGNGGPIDPRVGLVRDSFVGMAQVLDAMAARARSVRELADELPKYSMLKTKVELPPERLPAVLDLLIRQFPDAKPDRLDGLRLVWPDRWLSLRASNTEPAVRLIAEARTPAEARRLCQEARALIAAETGQRS